MKKNFLISLSLVAMLCVNMGCGSMSNMSKGAIIGGGGGAAAGAGIGAAIGGGRGAAIGAGIGAVVGSTTGAIIGNRMDKQIEELARIEGAQVEEITDINDLKAIKVTFADGILFATNSSQLSQSSQSALTNFARSLADNHLTDVSIYGHTDNTGTRAVNERISAERAQSVANFLTAQGISSSRLTTRGLAFDNPVADNSTAAGRAQNRRVEIFISANAEMIRQAEAGTLN